MIERAYKKMRVEELERLLAKLPQNTELLHAILTELDFRTTSRAQVLKRRLRQQLGTTQFGLPVNEATISQEHQPEVNRMPPTQSRNAGGDADGTFSDSVPVTRPVLTDPTESETPTESPREAEPMEKPASNRDQKRDLSPAQRGVSQLIEYVRVLIELSDRAIWSVASYNNVVLHENFLRNRIGIRHDLTDADGPVYLKIDRLRRTDPPEPPPEAANWLTVGRDPFKQPIVQSLLTTVMEAHEAEQLIIDGTVERADVTKSLKPKLGADLCDVVLRLERFPEVKLKIEHYISRVWIEWAQAERPRRETIDIYDRLFSVQQALKLEGADRPLEIVWGMGVARWKVPPNELDHPLVERLVELELDEAGAILVRPRGLDPVLATKPFAAMENPGTDLVARFAREHFSKLPPDQELSPFEKETFTPVLRYACAQFDRSGRFHPDHVSVDDRSVPEAGPSLIVTDTWVLYARPRSENFFIADLDRLRHAVEDSEMLPGPAIALVTEPSDEPTYVPSISGLRIMGESASGGVGGGAIGDARAANNHSQPKRYFFPKAFNEEQIAIVERLESSEVEGVVVQGPPGTGKTHTIANIICHYLATGRRVLVTSKSEGALAVLRDQIPDGIRELAISLLTSEREGLKQLESTVNILASKIATLDPKPTERDIEESEQRISELHRRIDGIDEEMRAFAEKHLRRIGADKNKDGILPIELAERIVRDRNRFEWLVDRPAPSAAGKPQFSDVDIAALRAARSALGADLDYLGCDLPTVSDLPDAATLAAIHYDLANAARIERDRLPDAPVMSLSEPDSIVRAEALLSSVKAIVAAHEASANAPWLGNLFTAWKRHGIDDDRIRPLTRLLELLSALIQKKATIASYAVFLSDNAHTQPELIAAVERAASGQRPFHIISLGKFEARNAFASIRILEKFPDRPDQWKKVSEVLAWRNELSGALAQWRALAEEFSLPTLSHSLDDAARSLKGIIDQANIVAECVRSHISAAQSEVARLFPYGLNALQIIDDINYARDAGAAIGSEVIRCRLSSAGAKLDSAKERLTPYSGRISAIIRNCLFEHVGRPEIEPNQLASDWTQLLTELERVRAFRPHLDTIAATTAAIADSGAPNWANSLRTIPIDGAGDKLTPDDWREAWVWARADSLLKSIDGRARLRALDDQRRVADDEMKRLLHEVVRLRTLLTLKARITRRVDAALQMFLTAIRKIGKGTGKSASRLRRDARDAMEASFAAVPCWIMPTWRVSESLPSTLSSFDLVIIDEASQSDIGALPALLRAKKVLVVGDDKQVSPTAAFIEEQKLRSLRMHYLDGQPFGALLLPGNSLYELALACFPGRRIMLKEHFRCVEPIIRFSFQFYTDEIVPVRVPKSSERLSPPLIDVHVTHGQKDRANRNLAEAEAIVDEIVRIVGDATMAERSIGVISLIGAKQAQLIQAMLLERIGEDAYLRHDIACGDSAVFQGKERDIVFLSMVECPETCTSKTALPFQQRFNVALSRARDREYLFHSVTEEMLKPEDLKAKVLRHFKNPMEGRIPPAGDLLALCQSGFEREVLTRLLKLGYRAQPQVKVGPYSIDLVVEGKDDRRLGIELDGDKYHGPDRWAEDLARQRVMERVGWRFWRCWGSSFLLDSETCMDDLIRSLEDLGIKPIGFDQPANVWTEFRTVHPKEGKIEDSLTDSHDEKSVANTGIEFPIGDPAKIVEIGDRVQVQANGDSRVRVVTLTQNKHDPDLGSISVRHPSGNALKGAQEDEEIDFEVDGKLHRWIVIRIEKTRQQFAA